MSDKTTTGPNHNDEGISLPSNTDQLNHIFGNRAGHLPDTPKNRQDLLDVANDSDAFTGTDKYGNSWHSKLLPDGSQLWTSSRNGKIQNGGKNWPPRDWDDESGFNDNPFKKKGK